MVKNVVPQRVFAIYQEMTSLKGVSSMKLHRELKLVQKAADFVLHRILVVWTSKDRQLNCSAEVDETCLSGKEKNKHAIRNQQVVRGAVGKTVVVEVKYHETNEIKADVTVGAAAHTLQGFVGGTQSRARLSTPMSPVHTAAWNAVDQCTGRPKREFSTRSARSPVSVFSRNREAANDGDDMIDQMSGVEIGVIEKRFMCQNLIADERRQS